MAASRGRSNVLAMALLAAACLLGMRWAFVPSQSPTAQPHIEIRAQLRGASVAAAAVVATMPLVAGAEDALVEYNMAGEFTQFFIVGYFGLTTAFTAVAFLSYLVLTKLKII
eukprot:CAMPEP_0179061074 /NCGR_PEP_ID=MMETSP0796-20121207/26197_1 /TAXON_ID=73915 /ORGANISM="Pyrodinium bahamense, Strain pbaha01" /LENGTH=111 /DNA_ID=CAMNT_0020757883 /DNA_START=76 /DNA_END=411 /DNA_ORIENTATION=+